MLVFAAALHHLNFARWDNMETFLPAIWYAHTEILHGRFPFWNPLQNLGEPLHALGIGGALYPPYTLAVALTTLFGWPEARALDLIAIAHAVFAAIGLSRLLIELHVRRPIAFVAAVSGVLSGYALIVGAMWVHAIPNLAWSIWAMWGLRRVIANEKARSGAVVATVALAAVLFTGHLQTGAYVWLAVWLWAFGLAAANGVLLRRLSTFLLVFVAAALLAAPVVLPAALIVPEASRMQGEMTPGRGFRPFALLGLLLPSIGASDGALVHPVMVTTFAGAWVVPALLLGTAVVLHRRTNADAVQVRAFVVTALLGLLLIWLNFGPPGGVYSLLHALPVWSHFRVPYKYFERAVPMLVIAGALGLELAARSEPPRRYLLIVLLVTVAATAVWVAKPAHEPLVWLAGATALVTLLTLMVLPASGAALALVPLTIVQTVALIGITHADARSKAYLFDRRDDARLQVLDVTARVLPLSESPVNHPYTRPLALFYAPTLDGYASMSGHRFALTSRRWTDNFHASVSGVPARRKPTLDSLLRSNLLRLTHVGQLVVAPADTAALHAVVRAFPDAPSTSSAHARIFDVRTESPLAYFATEQVRDSTLAVRRILMSDTLTFAAVVSSDLRRRSLPAARVTGLRFGRDRIAANVDAPDGGLLVFSTSYSREWRAVTNGGAAQVVPVNGVFAGVWVPPGTAHIELAIRRWPLFLGLALSLVGVGICILLSRASPFR
jgi:hypothetical protein